MFEIVVWDVTRTAKIEKRVRERAMAGICLHVHEDGCECNEPSVSLGLCRTHINHHNYELRSLPSKTAKARYRAELVRLGQALNLFEQRKFKRMRSSTFARMAEEVGRCN